MAGFIDNDDSPEEGRSLLRTNLFNTQNLLLPNHNIANPASSLPTDSTVLSTTSPQPAAITSPPHLLELRQNNPQDCSNLITASVNRATVEISRTIIALNATFSQQLQQASISASNGIKSAQSSATSTIQVVVLSASSATSSAFSSLTIANLAVTSANFALTNAQSSASTAIAAANSSLILANLAVTSISSASGSDVSTLSSSLSDLQASLTSVQSSASAAIAAAQSALAFASGSAAAQASSILASAASATQGFTTFAPQQTLPTLQLPTTISLTPAQIAAIVAGAVILTILLSFLVYFLAMKMKKRKERDSYLDEKDVASSPKKLPSRLSSALRTGNAMTIKFNPPKSSDAQPSPISALRFPEVVPEPAPSSNRKETSQASTLETKLLINSTFSTYSQSPNWPLTANNTNKTDMTSVKPLSSGFTFWPLNVDVQSSLIQSPERRKEPPIINLLNTAKTDDTIPYTSSELKNAFDELDLGSDQEVSGAINQNMGETSPHWEQTHQRRETPDEIVFNPFEDGEEEQISHQEEDPKVSELEQQPEISKPLGGKVSVENFPARNSYSETTQFFRTLETRVRHEISLNPLEDSAQKPLNESTEEPADQTLSEIASVPPLEQQTEEWSFEQLLPKQPTRVPKAETLALLQDEEQARSSTVPEIDKLLRIVAQDNERLADKPLFWSDFRPVEEDVESAMEMPPVRESKVKKDIAPLRESLPQEGDERGSENMARETMTSPFLMDPAVETELLYPDIQQQPPALVERNPEPLALPPAQERETSPLRINPQIRNITSMLAERKAVSISTALVLETETNKAGLDERQARGRSMLRTSDIIEARLSSIPQVKEDKDAPIEEHTEEERARTISPLRRNPVEITNVSYSETRNLSPLQRNLSTSISISASSMKRKSRTLSPPSLPRLNPTPTSLPSREESPLRRNPPFPIPSQPLPRPHTPTSSDPALRPQSNVGFNQTLARFQSLAEQSTVNGRQASTEVTQRAIAGIFIPGSLREQAVKNLSKSRERALGRSASAGKGL